MSRIRSALSVLAFVVAAPAAFAGGYQVPVTETIIVAPAAEVASAPRDWTGAYGGVTLGYVVSGSERVGFSDADDDFYIGEVGSFDLSGVQGGLRIGYRVQRDQWVFGAELGYEVSRAKDSFDGTDEDGDWWQLTSKVNNVAALRLKTGRLMDDRTMLYGIAGIARGNFTYDAQVENADGTGGTISRDYSQSGYVLGLGVERKFTDRMSVTGEWEYAQFGKTSLDIDGAVTRATPKYNILRMGVNFQF